MNQTPCLSELPIGVVTSDKMAEDPAVEIPRLVQHRQVRQVPPPRTVCYVHDENDESHAGDTVEIVESPARCRETKRWELVRVVEKSRGRLADAGRESGTCRRAGSAARRAGPRREE